jgi:hypothetical protein
MPIKIKYIKYLFMSSGLMLLYVGLADKNWSLAGAAIPVTIVLGMIGYGVERLCIRINRNPNSIR